MATGPSRGSGLLTSGIITQLIGGGSKLNDVVKFMDRGIARKRLRVIATAATIRVTLTPAAWLEKPQTMPPKAMAPCDSMMTVAFMRPRAQLGIVRCAATHSSEDARVHPAPARAATTGKRSLR